MSVNSKMTAIADTIRALLGLSGTMGLDAMATNLGTEQTNIANAFTAVGNKGGAVPSSKVSGNLASAIASIPESSGGSLPDGITALTTGTYTPSSDQKFFMTIDHDLGVIPNFCVWMMEADISTSIPSQACTIGVSFMKRTKYSQSYTDIADAHFMIRGYSSSGSQSGTSTMTTNYGYFTDTKVPFMGSTSYPIKAGYTYRWVCGVLDGVL